uniref:Glutaredoxin domain-containing cysteine-rich protein CG31559 n=1 Tax=Zeugodacus cucurbitae TaxID=28588 RepID=A0A0A1WPW6_ZEUCU
MATKTVINTNAPTTRGISILIDQNPQATTTIQQKPQQQQTLVVSSNCQQEVLRPAAQMTETAKITIYQNTTTTKTQMAPTPSTAITRTVLTKLQPQPSKLVATTTTTRIGVNGIDNNYIANNDHGHDVDQSNDDDVFAKANNDEQASMSDGQRRSYRIKSGEYESDQKTSYTTIKQKITTSTAVPTFPHLLLKVVSERGKANNGQTDGVVVSRNEDVHEKTNGNDNDDGSGLVNGVGSDVGKSQVNRNVAAAGGQNEQPNNNYASAIPMRPTKQTNVNEKQQQQTPKHGMMIIQCNGAEQHNSNNNYKNIAHNNVDAHDQHNDNDEHKANDVQQADQQVDQVGTLVAAAATVAATAPSNVYRGDESCVTSAIGNGQNAFEHYICTNAINDVSEHDRHEAGHSLCTADVQEQLESADVNANSNANGVNSLLTVTKTDCGSALTETDAAKRRRSVPNGIITNPKELNANKQIESKLHVLKIQIKPNEVHEKHDKQVTVVTLNKAQVQDTTQQSVKTIDQIKELTQQSAPVQIVDATQVVEQQKSVRSQASGESANELQHTRKDHHSVDKNVQKKMVQKPIATTPTASTLTTTTTTILNAGAVTVSSGGNASTNLLGAAITIANGNDTNNSNGNATMNGNGHAHNTNATTNTSVTELNVTHPSYHYYVMSSGQFSPCDTLDSGTGSDLESNGNVTPGAAASTQNKLLGTLEKLNAVNAQNGANGCAPKMELHMKATKIRLSGSTKKSALDIGANSAAQSHGEHARAGSFTDSEESESSSLSCDSLHSTEFIRQSSVSPTAHKTTGLACVKMLGSLLPDSLLRDIRDRKFPTNDFEAKYGDAGSAASADGSSDADGEVEVITTALPVVAIDEQDYVNVEHKQFLKERNSQNLTVNNSHNNKRASLPNKTFVLNANNGTFVDTKMNSMPRKYEADKYYNFHVREHENFRSFDISGGGVGGGVGGSASLGGGDLASFGEYETKSLQDDAFAGYKDIRCGSATSTIRSSKGTVRGVKNRVRNGIATFLQMQQPNVKNFKEKDAGKVVLYTTSMGIIRDTYAKCANVKQILRTLLVKFEERDVFMSIEYQQEIKERMHSEAIKVPQLFVEGQHIGDADTVERLNESGELRQLLKPYKSIATTFTCQTCGGYRLLPCPSCNGSKKSVHRNHFTAEFVALKCMNCDEVGLVKCHNC